MRALLDKMESLKLKVDQVVRHPLPAVAQVKPDPVEDETSKYVRLMTQSR
jgi:hypothetical protein